MRLRTIGAALFALSVPSLASATEWRAITGTGNPDGKTVDAIFLVDIDSMKPDRAWIYMIGPQLDFEYFAQFDCHDDKTRVLSIRGPLVANNNGEEKPQEWSYNAPSSPGADVLNFVCSGGTAKTSLNESFGSENPVKEIRRQLVKMSNALIGK